MMILNSHALVRWLLVCRQRGAVLDVLPLIEVDLGRAPKGNVCEVLDEFEQQDIRQLGEVLVTCGTKQQHTHAHAERREEGGQAVILSSRNGEETWVS